MKLEIEWLTPTLLKDDSDLIYKIDSEKLPTASGIYVFGRRWGPGQFEALYVGKAGNIRNRVRGHFNNLRLMHHLRKAKNGQRVLLAGEVITRPGNKSQNV